KFVKGNDALVAHMGFSKKNQLIGRHQYEIAQDVFQDSSIDITKLTEDFLKEDEEIFRGKELCMIHAIFVLGKLTAYFTHKFPERNSKNKIIASTHVSTEITSLKMLKELTASEQSGVIISSQTKKNI